MNRTTAHLRSGRLSGNWVAVYRDTRLRHDLHGAVPGGFEPGGPLATFGNEPNGAPNRTIVVWLSWIGYRHWTD